VEEDGGGGGGTHGLLLFKSIQGLLCKYLRGEDVSELGTGVGLVRGAIRIINLTHDQNIVSTPVGRHLESGFVRTVRHSYLCNSKHYSVINRISDEIIMIHKLYSCSNSKYVDALNMNMT
jgi:hypothetical protein